VLVTGGSSAIANRIYTVYNGQQLVAAINQAGNDPKIIRVIGHIVYAGARTIRSSANTQLFGSEVWRFNCAAVEYHAGWHQ
jgi:hypothetical protein